MQQSLISAGQEGQQAAQAHVFEVSRILVPLATPMGRGRQRSGLQQLQPGEGFGKRQRVLRKMAPNYF